MDATTRRRAEEDSHDDQIARCTLLRRSASFWLEPAASTSAQRARHRVLHGVVRHQPSSSLLVVALMLLFIVLYRRRKGAAAGSGPTHNTPLEIVLDRRSAGGGDRALRDRAAGVRRFRHAAARAT